MADTDATTGLHPAGAFLSIDSGPLQARLYRDSGHLELVGPDLAGAAHAVTITLAPPGAVIGGQLRRLGRVVSSTLLADGLVVRLPEGAYALPS